MHPLLGDLISETFYAGKITTFPQAVERFRTSVPPVISSDPSRLPDTPFVFIDLPSVPDTVGMKPPERKPHWTNQLEADACLDVISLLQANGEKVPSLAVLSPYRRQVRLLRRTVESASARLVNLNSFRANADDGLFGTVDSFQGNEADVVVVSLVRNNSRTGLAALGFLSDERRMNVLLSRAKWRLIVIGSLEFLRGCLPDHGILPKGDPLEFLERFLRFVSPKSGNTRDGVRIVSIDSLKGEVR
jgi:superfamily I DNA and/or RNA helicase